MSTKAQIKANRKNCKKSTGPQTPEGKAKVAKKGSGAFSVLQNHLHAIPSAHQRQGRHLTG